MNAIRLLARESKAIHKYFALAVFSSESKRFSKC